MDRLAGAPGQIGLVALSLSYGSAKMTQGQDSGYVQVRPEPSVQVRGSHWQAECPDKALLVCAKLTPWRAGQVVDLTVPAFTGRGGPQPPPPHMKLFGPLVYAYGTR